MQTRSMAQGIRLIEGDILQKLQFPEVFSFVHLAHDHNAARSCITVSAAFCMRPIVHCEAPLSNALESSA